MKKFGLILCFLFVTSCSLNDESFYQNGGVPSRPVKGFDRQSLFPSRLLTVSRASSSMSTMFIDRTDWNPSRLNFRSAYPSFNIELLAFNNFNSPKNFTWEERIMFADALELVIFAINHPLFEKKMKSETFFNNDTTQQIPSMELVEKLRKTKLSFIIAKEDLADSVLAQATVGGFNHIIWFRSDINYQDYSVLYLATILGHELTHNLGYLHSSNVPYTVDGIIGDIIREASTQDAQLFEKNTPYYEDMFLKRVRESSPKTRSLSLPVHIQKDRAEDFGNTF